MAENRYAIDYARLGTSKCKKCKQGITKKDPRIAKLVANPFSEDGGDMKQYHHVKCMFEALQRARPSTKKIEEPDDLEGFDVMEDEEKKLVKELIAGKHEILFTELAVSNYLNNQQDRWYNV